MTRALGILEHHGVEVVVVVVGRTRAHPPNQIPSSISISDTPTSSDNSTPWVGFSSRFFRRRILLCITGPPPRTWSYVRRLSSRLWVIILSQRVGLEAQIHRRLIGLHDPAKSPNTFCTAGGPPVPAQSKDALPVPAPFGRDLGCCPVPAKLWSRCRVLSCCGGPWPCHLPGHARRGLIPQEVRAQALLLSCSSAPCRSIRPARLHPHPKVRKNRARGEVQASPRRQRETAAARGRRR